LEVLSERIMLGDGTLAGVLITGGLLPDHSPLEQAKRSFGAAAFTRTLPADTPALVDRPPRDHGNWAADSDSAARLPDLDTILTTPPQDKVAQEVTYTQASDPFDTLFVAATDSPKAGDEFASSLGEFDSSSAPSASAKNRPPLPSDTLQNAGADAGVGGGGGVGGASTNTGGGGGSSGGGGGAGPGVNNANQFSMPNLGMAGSPTANPTTPVAASTSAAVAPLRSPSATTSAAAASVTPANPAKQLGIAPNTNDRSQQSRLGDVGGSTNSGSAHGLPTTAVNIFAWSL
jgi:hypothetical protein